MIFMYLSMEPVTVNQTMTTTASMLHISGANTVFIGNVEPSTALNQVGDHIDVADFTRQEDRSSSISLVLHVDQGAGGQQDSHHFDVALGDSTVKRRDAPPTCNTIRHV